MSENKGKLRVLVAPLDWGLGHTTRCVPIITALLAASHEVIFAGNGHQQEVISQEFPLLECVELDGYNITYPKKSRYFRLTILSQLGRINGAIQKEHHWLASVIRKRHIDIVISDNRYGLYHKNVQSVIITHQLAIKSGLNKLIDNAIKRLHYRLINRFNKCWIPDEEGPINIGGELSHPRTMPTVTCNYIGILSRLKPISIKKIDDHLFISISGPEPQRSLFENMILEQLLQFDGTAVVVRGISNDQKMMPSTDRISFYNHLASEEYSSEMQRASYVISRSGYSTLMDLAITGARAMVVATPGQTEQEYLAIYGAEKKRVLSFNQDNFSIDTALKALREMNWENEIEVDQSALMKAIEHL